MKKLVLFLVLVIASNSVVMGQHLYDMVHKNLDPITITLKDGTKKEIESNEFSLPKRVIIPLVGKGVTDFALIDGLKISHNDQSSAKIELEVTVCPKFYIGDTARAQSYYFSFVFYDKNREPLFGHTFISDYGKSVFDVHTDLKSTPLEAVEETDCFTLFGNDILAIHQDFIKDPNPDEVSDPLQELVEPIEYVAIRVYMLAR